MSVKSIVYNSFNFQTGGWQTQDISYRNLPVKTVDLEPLARRDGFRLVNTYYSQKDITISGSVTAATEAALKTTVDAMKKALNADEANLDIDDGGTTIRWVAIPTSIQVPERHFHITTLPFSITFRCQPFGKLTTSTTNTNSAVNTSIIDDSITFVGSVAPRPMLTWTVSGTPTTPITGITFENNTTEDTFAVTGLVLSGDGDYLKLDTENMLIVYNTGSGEIAIDFTGVIPTFTTNVNSYTVTIVGGGASKTLNQNIVYYESYL